MTPDDDDEDDAAVTGGGLAGPGGAATLGRSRRAVTVADGGQPRAPAAGAHRHPDGRLTPVGHPSGTEERLPVDQRGGATPAGVRAAGSVADPSARGGAASSAGAQVDAHLAAEHTRRAGDLEAAR